MSKPKLTLEERARQKFESDTADHELTVLRDDGLYRHLRCQAPGTWMYGFDVVTWPGYLFIGGDVETYTFSRIPDMFDFFRDGTKYSGGINPHYWAQKLQGDRAGRDISRHFTPESFRTRMLEWVRQECEEGDCEMYPSLLVGALEREGIFNVGSYEDEARDLLRDLEHDGILPETWEWDLKDYDPWFIWCCWAIVWAIARYDDLDPAELPSTLTVTRDDQERLGAIATVLELQGVDRDGRDSRFLRQLRDKGRSK